MLTEQQQRILDFILREQETRGVMPSTREIQAHFGFASQTAAINHLRALERKGVLRRLAGKARALVVVAGAQEGREKGGEVVNVPVYGRIAAGLAAESEPESEGCVSVDMSTIGLPRGGRVFALRVRGDSMVGAHILDGDTVILEFREPVTGDVVAALIDGETTLKRYLVRGGRPVLKAENPAYPDLIPARELVIQGVVIALIRKLKNDLK